jgi:hypothetical protein
MVNRSSERQYQAVKEIFLKIKVHANFLEQHQLIRHHNVNRRKSSMVMINECLANGARNVVIKIVTIERSTPIQKVAVNISQIATNAFRVNGVCNAEQSAMRGIEQNTLTLQVNNSKTIRLANQATIISNHKNSITRQKQNFFQLSYLRYYVLGANIF